MCHITDLLLDGSLLDQLFSIVSWLLCISNTGVIIVCCWIRQPSLGVKVHTTGYTRTPASFANIFRYHLSFSKKFFRPKATDWWNDLPMTLISSSATKFSCELYNYLLYTSLFVCFCTLLVLYLIVL